MKLKGLKNASTGKDLIGAVIVDDDNGNSTLFSYYTPIVRILSDGSIERLAKTEDLRNGVLSKSTALHLKHFCGMTAEEFYAKEVK